MFWPTKAHRIQLGPNGIHVDGRRETAGLTLPELAQGLDRLTLQPGSRIVIEVSEAWVKALWLPFPAAIRTLEERQAFATHRLRDIFSPEIAAWPRRFAERRGQPWSSSFIRRAPDATLLTALPPELLSALDHWQRKTRVRLIGIRSLWGSKLAQVPTSTQGILVCYDQGRTSVGAWANRRWLGWRSFLAESEAQAQTETLRWLQTLSWPGGIVPLWFSGWQSAPTWPAPWSLQTLPAGAPHRRPALFRFAAAADKPAMPRYRRILFAALALTLIASLLASLPDASSPVAESQIATVRVRPSTAPVTPPPEPPPAPEVEPVMAAEAPNWPVVLGSFEHHGRYILFRGETGEDSARQGAVIQNRFRIDRITLEKVHMTDLHTQAQKEIALDPSGEQP